MEAMKTKPLAPTWRDELALLAKPAGVLLACLFGAGLLLGVSSWLRDSAEADWKRALQTRRAASARLHNVGIERRELEQFAPRFAQLQAAGMIGDEDRLRWIETVQASQSARKLISADYEIEPQQAIAAEPPLQLGDYTLRGSRMRLQLGMVHELDLFNMLGDLRAAGPYTVQDCQIKRLDVPAEVSNVARMTADCTLIWLTLGGAPQPASGATDKEMP